MPCIQPEIAEAELFGSVSGAFIRKSVVLQIVYQFVDILICVGVCR